MNNTAQRNIVIVEDVALNDSDKTLTVPAGETWHVLNLYVAVISTATVGNRQVDVLFTTDADLPLAKAVAGAVQAAGVTREYVFSPSSVQETSFTGGVMYRAMPSALYLLEGYKVRVYDSAAIDAAADDMSIRLVVEKFIE